MKSKYLGKMSDALKKLEDIEGGGVYIFIHNELPFYVGTAQNFQDRLFSHQKLFRQGLRTYFTKSFKDWPSEYLKYKENDHLSEILYIPKSSTPDKHFDNTESVKFFEGLELILLVIEDVKLHKSIEKRLQLGLMQYYYNQGKLKLPDNELKKQFHMPGTRSTLLGKVEPVQIYQGDIDAFKLPTKLKAAQNILNKAKGLYNE